MSKEKSARVVIVGGGISGFSCALELKGLKARCTILEKEKTVGGRARSYTESGYVFDQGLHFFVGGFKSLIPILERSGIRMTTVGERVTPSQTRRLLNLPVRRVAVRSQLFLRRDCMEYSG